jgi:hypothetical protein
VSGRVFLHRQCEAGNGYGQQVEDVVDAAENMDEPGQDNGIAASVYWYPPGRSSEMRASSSSLVARIVSRLAR